LFVCLFFVVYFQLCLHPILRTDRDMLHYILCNFIISLDV
jgi:hypothetical protein